MTKQDDPELFNVPEWEEIIDDATALTRAEGAALAIDAGLDIIPETLDDLADKVAGLIEGSVDVSSDKITESINTIDKELKKDIRKILADNALLPEKDLQKLLIDHTKDRFSRVYTQSRAETIAATTASNVTNSASEGTYVHLGYDLIWLSQRDSKVRKTHNKADGQKRGSDGLFKVGTDKMKYPTAGSKAEENVNCRCNTFPFKEGS